MPSSATVYAGQRITSSVIARAVPLFAYKATSQSVTSSTTLQNDNDLTLSLAASTVYRVEMVLMNGSGGAAGGLKLAFSVPAGTTGDYLNLGNNIAGSDSILDATSWTTTTPNNHNNGVVVKGLLITGGSAGTFTLQWAQNSSSGTATVVGADSYLEARQAV